MVEEKLLDGTVYLMFLKGRRNTPGNTYVGVTTKSLDERMRMHKSRQTAKSYKRCDSKLYRTMREKGLNNWDIVPLAERWLSTRKDRREIEKYYIRLLKPDLNSKDGSSSDEECEKHRERAMQPWTCPTCLTESRVGSKWQHRQTKYHKAIDRFMTELD